jgi:hypothetical protein
MKHFMPLLVALTALSAPLPALAQSSDRVLVIFGKDKCPTDSTGNEIVVCSRRPEAERYRIPKELRTSGALKFDTFNRAHGYRKLFCGWRRRMDRMLSARIPQSPRRSQSQCSRAAQDSLTRRAFAKTCTSN